MRSKPSSVLLALALGAILAGCATPDGRRATYEQALAPWQGASEDQLRARWGKPASEEAAGTGTAKWLVYVVDSGSSGETTVSFGFGGFGFGGGRTGVGLGVGATAPVQSGSPTLCTTRFLIEGGKVDTWTFDGPGCGF